MARLFGLLIWVAAGAFLIAVCGVVASLPKRSDAPAAVRARPPEIVLSPRLGHYDQHQGQYVWWR
jgi:hypothetical protein